MESEIMKTIKLLPLISLLLIGSSTLAQVPTVTIGAPSTLIANSTTEVSFTITYTNATSVTLDNTFVSITHTETSGGSITVTGSGTETRSLTISGISGDGNYTVSINAGSSSNGEESNTGAGPSAAVTVDNTAPSAPSVTGTTPTNDQTPTWSWTAGGGGNGTFRYGYTDGSDWISEGSVATEFTPATDLSAAAHTLYVQERDAAGNWSTSGSFAIIIDITPPSAPSVTGTTPTNDQTPTWSWTAGGGGNGTFRYGYTDGSDWISEGSVATEYTPATDLSAAAHTLYVQERDAAGNWSTSGSFAITIDITPPSAPSVTGTTPTNDQTPTWSWTAGGGGNGTFRYGYTDGSDWISEG
ncbi:MAG: hypothetical protein RBT74_12970, partial [Tenuifilaceae bacterium]|nr:hypothetical protein [Tenuifilaceae bacterium]